MIRLLTAIEQGKFTKESLIDELLEDQGEVWFSVHRGPADPTDDSEIEKGPWKCKGKEDIPYGDPLADRLKNKAVINVTYGARYKNLPLANRETDVDLSGHEQSLEQTQSSLRHDDRKPPIKAKPVDTPAPTNPDSYWDNILGSGGGQYDRIVNHRRNM